MTVVANEAVAALLVVPLLEREEAKWEREG